MHGQTGKKIGSSIFITGVFFFSAFGLQAGLDPPHTGTVGCLSCHQMTSTYPKLLPPLGLSPQNIDETIANATCTQCHCTDPDVPCVATHSSRQADNGYGNWSVECWVCHNQHLQEQKYNGSTYGKYIRRSINLANITGLAKTGNKSVVFTGPESLADGDANYNGICEVCHTQTSHFRNNGSGSDQNHGNRQGTDCMDCHNHANGFIHGGGGGANCIECHGHDPGYEYEPGKFSQGKGTFTSHSAHTEHDPDDLNGPNLSCGSCHNPGNYPFFKSGTDSNGDGRFNLTETDVCNACHNDATGIATGLPVLMPPPAWNTTPLTCTGCHAIGPDYTSGAPKANSHAAHSGFACNLCHAATTADGASINDVTVHPDGAYTLQPGTGVSFTYSFNAGGSTCSNISCHGNQNATWGSSIALACNSCHGYPPQPGDGKDINNQFDGGKGAHITSWDNGGRGGHIIVPANLQPATDVYGDADTGYLECSKCHENGVHGNGTVDMQIMSGPWSTPVPPGPDYVRNNGFGLFGSPPLYQGVPAAVDTPKTCSNIVCHMGDTPRWSCPGGE